jgi:hypothetical protein
MTSPETASAPRPSLAQDWLRALRYWLRGRNGVIALMVLAVVIGAALSWSWLVALGIAPLLLAFAPCAAMCALGLCASKMAGRSCSSETNPVASPKPDTRVAPALAAGESDPIPRLDKSTWSGEPTAAPAISLKEVPKPEERS